MSDLISRSAIKYEQWSVGALCEPLMVVRKKTIDSIPAVDAVPVVRCKDCIHAREMDKYEKQLYLDECVGCTCFSASCHSIIMSPTDFCSFGEPRGERKE